jgi:uncharacterized protein YegP (UPF0339 family)
MFPSRDEKEAAMNRFEAFRDMEDKWRWRLIGAKGRVKVSSDQAFDSRDDAVQAAEAVKAEAADAAVSDLPGVGPKELIASLIRREEARRLEVAVNENRRSTLRRPAGARRARVGVSPSRIRAVGSRRSG